jgi:hypothetical protein
MVQPDAPVGLPVAFIRGVVVEQFLRSQDHQDDLLRELKLIQLGDRFELTDGDVEPHISTLVAAILDRYDSVRTTTRAQALAARDSRQPLVDLQVPLTPGIAEALLEWIGLVEAADELCAGGRLLTLPATEEVRQLRRRYVDEVLRQIDAS